MLTKPTLVAIAVASLLAGCSVGPNYMRPSIYQPEEYQGKAAMDQRQATGKASLSNWWQGFADPLLIRYVNQALAQNLDLAQATARVKQARAGLGITNAALQPTANLTSQVTRAYQSEQTPSGQIMRATPGFDRYGNTYEANIGASWELDLFGGLHRDQEAAVAEYQASEAALSATQLTIAAQTADIYITIRGMQTRLDITRQQVGIQQELLDLINLLAHKGLVAEIEVKENEATLSRLKASIPELLAGIDNASNTLDVMLGTVPGSHKDELASISKIPSAPRISEIGSPRDLLRRRPDLIIAERRLAAANARIGSAMAEYYPKLSLSGLLGSSTTVSSNLFSGGASQSAGILGLRWRLFDFNRINAQIELAKGQESELLSAYRLSVLHATEDVENAFSNLINFEQQYRELAQSEQALANVSAMKSLSYQKGTISKIEVLQANQKLLSTTDLKTLAQIASSRAAVSTFRTLGGGWEPTK